MLTLERREHGMDYPPTFACFDCDKTREQLWELLRGPDFVADYYLGYRFWQRGELPELRSQNGTPWQPLERMEARCDAGRAVAPCSRERGGHGGYGCGIYATKRLAWLGVPDAAPTYVVAKVALWGRVWEHGLGYRAQYCYPQAFLSPPPELRMGSGWLVTLEAYAAAWGIPLLGVEEIEDP